MSTHATQTHPNQAHNTQAHSALLYERRNRLAAERLLELKQAELFAAHKQLPLQSGSLYTHFPSGKTSTEHYEIEAPRHENEPIKDLQTTANTALSTDEHRLWGAFETIQDGFAVFDPSNTLIAANSAYLSIFDGLQDVRPGVTYQQILELIVEEGIVDIGDMSRRGFIDAALLRWSAPSCDPHTIRLWNNQFIKMTDRRPPNGDMISFGLNITEAVRQAEKLKDTSARAEAINRTKSAFLANMSHEIRTPMNGMVGMAELLCETQLSGEQTLYVETIKNSGESLLNMINNVLDYSKIEASKLSIHQEPFDLERCVQDVIVLLQPTAKQKQIDLIIDYDMFMPTRFLGDQGRFRQILINLIGNAVKFTEQGHVIVRIVGIPEENETQTRVHISIEDTGIGIHADMQAYVFGEFNQVENESNRKFEGTGLGLAITKQMISLMNGEIWVDSEIGVGSCFGFSCSLTLDETQNHVENVPTWMHKAYLVDHIDANCATLEKQLTTLGFDVTSFSSAATFAASPMDGDIFLLNSNLPDADMPTLIQSMRDIGVLAPILLMTSGPVSAAILEIEHTAHLHIPLLRANLCSALSALVPTQTSPATSDCRKMKVLAAEDNKTNRLVFEKMIQNLDIDLEFANNGRDAIELYKTFQPDLIFMDISMPEMNGKEATHAIRDMEKETGKRIPIIALTAHAMAGDDHDILAAGLDHYMTKPLRKAGIIEQIQISKPSHCRPIHAQDFAFEAESEPQKDLTARA